MLCIYMYIYIYVHYTHRYYMIFYIISTRFFLRQNSHIGCSKMLEMKIDIFSFSLLSQNRIEFWDLNWLGTPDSTIFQGRKPHGFRRFALEKSRIFLGSQAPWWNGWHPHQSHLSRTRPQMWDPPKPMIHSLKYPNWSSIKFNKWMIMVVVWNIFYFSIYWE